jgi:hypothetical protein
VIAELLERVRVAVFALGKERRELHTFAYVGIRQNTSVYVSIRQLFLHSEKSAASCTRPHTSAYVNIRRHTSAYVGIRRHTSAYVLVSVFVLACVSIRQHM